MNPSEIIHQVRIALMAPHPDLAGAEMRLAKAEGLMRPIERMADELAEEARQDELMRFQAVTECDVVDIRAWRRN